MQNAEWQLKKLKKYFATIHRYTSLQICIINLSN